MPDTASTAHHRPSRRERAERHGPFLCTNCGWVARAGCNRCRHCDAILPMRARVS
jgi:hypothetical protein